jgi:hypothetical protein
LSRLTYRKSSLPVPSFIWPLRPPMTCSSKAVENFFGERVGLAMEAYNLRDHDFVHGNRQPGKTRSRCG